MFAVVAAVCLLPVLGWIELARSNGIAPVNAVGKAAGSPVRPFSVRGFLSYVWQFYLPRLPGMHVQRVTPGLSVYDIWLREGWGVFGWLEVRMPEAVYVLAAAFTSVVAIASAAIVATFRDRLRWQLIGFFAVTLIGLLFGLHLTEYRSVLAGQGAILQGRYLLPALGLLGLAVALVVGRLPAAWRAPVCGVLIAGMLLLQIVALGTVGARYYT